MRKFAKRFAQQKPDLRPAFFVTDACISNVNSHGRPILRAMRPQGSQEQLERRRRRAVALSRRGYGASEIAEMLKTTPQSVCRWLRACRRRGEKALAARPAPGRPPKLSKQQRRGLARCLVKGASAFGFGTDSWTCPRVARLIEQRYGVHYHVDHIPRLLASLGLSPSGARTPSRRAR